MTMPTFASAWNEFIVGVSSQTTQITITVLLIYWVGYLQCSFVWILFVITSLNFAMSRRQHRIEEASQQCQTHFQNAYRERLKKSFPDFEECQFGNQILASLWVHIKSAVGKFDVFSKWDPFSIFDDVIDSHTRPLFELGDIPPRICGVRILSPDSNCLLLDFHVSYHGNARLATRFIKFQRSTEINLSSITAQFVIRLCINISSGEIIASISGSPEYDFDLRVCHIDMMSNLITREIIMSKLRKYVNSSLVSRKWIVREGTVPIALTSICKDKLKVKISSFHPFVPNAAKVSMILCRIPETTFVASEDDLYEKTGEFRSNVQSLEIPVVKDAKRVEIVAFMRDLQGKHVETGRSHFLFEKLACLKKADLHDSLIMTVSDLGILYLDISLKPVDSKTPGARFSEKSDSTLCSDFPAKGIVNEIIHSNQLSLGNFKPIRSRFCDVDKERFEIRLEMISAKDISKFLTKNTPVSANIKLKRQYKSEFPEIMQLATKVSFGMSPIWNQVLNFGIWSQVSSITVCVELWNSLIETNPTLMDSIEIDLINLVYSTKFDFQAAYQTFDFDRALSRSAGSVQFLLHLDRQ